jgi:outer membrane immunogenic protein
MHKLLIAGLAWAVLVASRAVAADFAPPIAVAEPVFDWSGFYAGLSAGGRWSNVTWTTVSVGPAPGMPPDPTTTPASFQSSTGRAGGYLGFNWQFAPQWLIGIEADLAWGNTTKRNGGVPGTFGTSGLYAPLTAANFDTSWVKQRWDASVRARIGFIATTWLIYATAGVTLQSIEVGASCSGTGDSWCMDGVARYEPVVYGRTGWTIGAGAETALSPNWLARVEYRYTVFGNIDYTFFTTPQTVDDVASSVKLQTQTVVVGITYKL